jgi:hypothetical protein
MASHELEPVPDSIAVVMAAESACQDVAWEAECTRRVPELADVDDDEFYRWQNFLEELDDDYAHADDLAQAIGMLDATDDDDAAGWIEDEHGGAVFIPYG